ncbi:uncharacterized protein CTHT_0010440 [Thermochaetoides thermophila DSM 1495]|uniref:Chitin-binding type-1 domain-containing protein n=1 Tax=Chaetomium thermophilum (strain DSM 1495 / CBS 144.50 / IMI 039719) TaxID=759272 RepID=G0S0L5_CHATD|nr:hypothetical protein CTHT_0010440 [Thermochaetoides thermophila DSM 1495]EGS22575.1 hypothetical protein CTHT_0010440 [Thermochaetoides thermophila DSM 1495]
MPLQTTLSLACGKQVPNAVAASVGAQTTCAAPRVCGWPKPTPTPPTTTISTTTTSSTAATTSSSTATTTTSQVISPSSGTVSTSVIPTPTGPLLVTTNGQCGNNTICIGNPNFGPCCSQFFWCGSSIEYCGAGCQSQFGACFGVPGIPAPPASNGTSPTTRSTSQAPPASPSTISTTTITTSSTTTSSTASPTPIVTIPPGMVSTTDGRCGNGVTCLGSTWGRCCTGVRALRPGPLKEIPDETIRDY